MQNTNNYDTEYWQESLLSGTQIGFKEAMSILNDLDLFQLMILGSRLTSKQVGDVVTYAVSYNINYSNYCSASCPICAFYVPAKLKGKTDKGYELSVQQVRQETQKAKNLNATEIHIVGGFNPYLGMEYYESVFRAVKSTFPEATLKALTIPEIDFIARTTGNSLKETVLRFRDAGMDAHTGGGAEIFDPKIRKQITTSEKISGEKWLEDAKIIHSLGIPGNSTMTYGHVETWESIVDHMIKLRDNQLEVPGILSFIPLKFSPDNTPLQKMGKVVYPGSGVNDLKVISMARILMGTAIRNISVYWVAIGKLLAQIALDSGGSDLVGTAFSEKIFGATDRKETATTQEINYMIREIGRIPAQRNTFYDILSYF
jgi:CofH subfamily radical SAM domain protein